MATTCRPGARNSAPMCPSCLGGGNPAFWGFSGGGGDWSPFSSCGPAQLRCAQLALFNWKCAALIKDPTASSLTPWSLWRLPRQLRGDFYLERELDFEERRQRAAQGPLCWRPGRGATMPAPCATSAVGGEPEQASVRHLAWPCCARPMARCGVAIERLGPVSLPCCGIQRRRSAGPAAGATPGRGVRKAGVLRCSSMGVPP